MHLLMYHQCLLIGQGESEGTPPNRGFRLKKYIDSLQERSLTTNLNAANNYKAL